MWKYLLIFWMCTLSGIEIILTDIEGTTTSISFVHDVLFPYAKAHVRDYLLVHCREPSVAQVIDEVRQITETPNAELAQVTETLLTWMEQDKKITPLKTLQGMMWKDGYERGAFRGHVYDDAFSELQRWKKQGLSLYVYSSGSVPAQKLLFAHSVHGDMTPLFSGYFDTKVGGKKEKSSYQKIAEELKIKPAKILFLSDVIEELDAAKAVGMQTFLIVRDEKIPSSNCPHPVAHNFLKVRF